MSYTKQEDIINEPVYIRAGTTATIQIRTQSSKMQHANIYILYVFKIDKDAIACRVKKLTEQCRIRTSRNPDNYR